MPGEERKFKRRRIVAFAPARKRERDRTVSQAVVAGAPARGVVVTSTAGVSVGMGRGVAVGSAMSVTVGEGSGEAVAVSGGDVGETGTTVGVAGGIVPVGGSGIEVGGEACGGDTHIRTKARISSRMATINLKRS